MLESRLCEYCSRNRATHYCSNCGHWVCNSPACEARAIAAGAAKIGAKVAAYIRGT